MKILDWLCGLAGQTKTEQVETTVTETVSQEAAKIEAEAPAQAVSVFHAMLLELEKHEAGHPMLLHMTQWVDGLIESKGADLVNKLETAALTALAVKYPLLAPLLMSAANGTAPSPATPPEVSASAKPG